MSRGSDRPSDRLFWRRDVTCDIRLLLMWLQPPETLYREFVFFSSGGGVLHSQEVYTHDLFSPCASCILTRRALTLDRWSTRVTLTALRARQFSQVLRALSLSLYPAHLRHPLRAGLDAASLSLLYANTNGHQQHFQQTRTSYFCRYCI